MSYLGQGNQNLQPATTPVLKDYQHASKTFLTNGYQYTPRLKFLFHVYFNINTANIPQLQAAYGSGAISTIGLLVKNVELPKFKIDTTTLNQYNRKRVVQTKVKYEPSKIVFHDDQADLIRNMWYDYYSYYYGDPNHQYQGISTLSGTMGKLMTQANAFAYNTNDIYNRSLLSQDWGYQGETYHDGTNLLFSGLGGKPAFFRDITVYGLSEKKFAQWTMINPLITSWGSDTYDYNEGGGTMSNDMTFEYESVKYYSGTTGSTQPSSSVYGFADPANYDTKQSSITTEYGRNSVYSQSGLVPAVRGKTEDLSNLAAGLGGLGQVLGAVQTAGVVYNALTNSTIANTELPGLTGTISSAVSNGISGVVNSGGFIGAAAGFIFPSPGPSAVQTNNNTDNGIQVNNNSISQAENNSTPAPSYPPSY